jgi:catechol 2,3-dioxygenase-like lactoylglutathione lyase family enzyme
VTPGLRPHAEPGESLCSRLGTRAPAANVPDVEPRTLDHVALWVADREPIAQFCERHLGMHVIANEAKFTLIGSDARRGKLTLFDADGPREQGLLKHIGLRVSDEAAARSALPNGTPDVFDIGEGIHVTLVEAATDVEYDLDHVALWSAAPEVTARDYGRYGFIEAGAKRVEVGGAFVELHEGEASITERPLLNHLAVLVESADEVIADAGEQSIEVESVVDAANTYAAFLWGPERVRIEYVEHKPTFSLT